jgi:hypothetical protein
MRPFTLALVCVWILSFSVLIAQDEAIQGTDYEYFIETEEIGTDFKVISYYLKNISENKILFFNFNIEPGSEIQQIVKAVPDHILILDPHRTSKFCTLKIPDSQPQITWRNRLLFPSVGFNKFPEDGKHYVFFWESMNQGTQTIYSYFLKNICDRRMKFSDFALDATEGIQMRNELSSTALYLWPDSTVLAAQFSIPKDGEAPSLNWQAIFTNFQPTADEFCNQLIKILEAAGEGDFGSVRGKIKNSAGYVCTIILPDVSQAIIYESNGKWQFNGQVGGTGLKKDIDDLFSQFSERLDSCIPDLIALEIIKNKSSKNKSAVFSGFVDNKKYSALLEVVGAPSQPNEYKLMLTIFAAE